MQRKKKVWFHHNIVFFCWEYHIRKKMTKMKIYLYHKSVILWWKCDGHIFVERMWLCLLNTKSWLCDNFVIRMSYQEKDVKTKNILYHKSLILWWKCEGHIFVKRMWLCLLNTKSWICDDFVIANNWCGMWQFCDRNVIQV